MQGREGVRPHWEPRLGGGSTSIWERVAHRNRHVRLWCLEGAMGSVAGRPLSPALPLKGGGRSLPVFPQPLIPVSAMFSMIRRRKRRKTISIGTVLRVEPAISFP
jgi:hypothetical protein